ncbi:MAG: motility associated factor glycosyltransferase family protein [Spirochaetales bacterium]|nr:motility associated factor glycosyltransferase family protein [Spirochaetales bacterium]
MSLLETNLGYIDGFHPSLKHVAKGVSASGIEILSTPSGNPTMRYKGLYIHSSHNPVKEASQLAERATASPGISCCIIYGFGLAYHIEAFLEKRPETPVLIVEPDISVFLKALETRNLRPVLASRRVSICLGPIPGDILPYLERLPLSEIQMIKLRSRYTQEREYFLRIDGLIGSVVSAKEINLNTLKRFGKLWVKNLVKNIHYLIGMPGISLLKGRMTGIPALVLASGPSLDNVMPHLYELSRRMLVIAVDTSLRACIECGIEPDFLVIVDPQYWNTRHIDWLDPQKTILVSESSTHPRIFTLLRCKGFLASSFFPLGRFFESIVGHKGVIGAGGSVATAAWDLARGFGACPIAMAGLDLGYPRKQTHFRGAFFEQRFHMLAFRFLNGETMSFRYLREASPFPETANDGQYTLTDRRMFIYKRWFESQMAIYPETETLNLSPKGIRIEGMNTSTVGKLLDLPVIRENLDKRLEEIRAITTRSPLEQETGRIELKQSIESLCEDLGRLRSVAAEGISITRKASAGIRANMLPRESIEALNRIDRLICSESSRIIAGFLLQPVIQGILHASENTGRSDAREVLAVSEDLYRQLSDSARYHHMILSRALDSLTK